MRFCVAIIAIGDIFYAEDSLKLFKDYFTYHGIEYHIITEPPLEVMERSAHPAWVKLLPHRILPGYDCILVWDLDLLPRSREVNILEHFDVKKLCMAWDTGARLAYEQGKYIYVPSFRYNSGLMAIPKEYAPFIEGVFDKFAPGIIESYEQYYLNASIVEADIEIHELPDDLNMLCGTPHFETARLQHYTGTPDAKLKIEGHVKKYFYHQE